jgi:oligopeptide transport system substrate-binding protein
MNRYLALVWIYLSVLVIWLAGCQKGPSSTTATPTIAAANPSRSYLLVDEIVADPTAFVGQVVTVRGWSALEIATTLLACFPAMCECNKSWANLNLGATPNSDRHQMIAVEGFSCSGNECSLTCQPFNAHDVPAFEFTGTLQLQRNDPLELKLVNIDLSASYELRESDNLQTMTPAPLQTGTFHINTGSSYLFSTPSPEPSLVTYYRPVLNYDLIFDPQQSEDSESMNYHENLFVQLTNYDLSQQTILPETAVDWVSNETATIYTFTLRTDIPWVSYQSVSERTIQSLEETGHPRFVTAQDFAYGIRRNCDPESEPGFYAYEVVSPTIKGCAAALRTTFSPTPPELLDAIGVHALTNNMLVIELTQPTSFFPVITSLPAFSAVPRWTIEAQGENWTEADYIMTSGRFVLIEKIPHVRVILQRNPWMPIDMRGQGNIEQVLTTVVPDVEVSYELWLKNEMDVASIESNNVVNHLEQFPNETLYASESAVFFLAFRMTKPPFDNVRVRRAFSAATDREALINQVRAGLGLPMRHFTPPSLWGAPLIDEVGVGFDPEYAREQLAAAGYPNCVGLPTIDIFPGSSASGLNVVEYLQQEWSKNLDCPLNQFRLLNCSFVDSEESCQYDPVTPDEKAPHIIFQGWGAYYADTFSTLGSYLGCTQASYMHRPCTEVDEWLAAARATTDPTQRTALYRQIEEALFGPEGEFPVIPLFVRTTPYAQHRWLTTTPSWLTGAPWYDWAIDLENQTKARNEG